MPAPGKLITLEGPDHALLDRQAARLCRWLRDLDLPVDRTAEPTGGPVGVQIRLHDQGRLHFTPQSLALLLVADRLDHLEKENGILSLLAAGRHVLCVGYTLSAYARLCGEVPLGWHRRINARCRVPDLALYIGPDAPDLPKMVGLVQSPLTTGEEWTQSVPDAERWSTTPLASGDAHSSDFATPLPETGETIAWIDAAAGEEAIARHCRRHLSSLLSLGEA
jgi:hypothetical protein